MKLEIVEDLTLYKDNDISITLSKNMESQYQRKHINV